MLFAQNFDEDLLDAYFDILEENDKFNGSVVIAKDGEIIYQKSIGFADYENKRKNNTETAFRIGSISETFTATMMMQAVDEGKITTEETINKYFPMVKNSDKITIDMLLSHRSGIFNFTQDSTYLSWNSQPKTEKELIQIISDYPSNFEPGAKFEYSNSNYILLSIILEKLYQKSYGELLNEKIIIPLNLKRTFFGGKINPANNEAYSYKYTGKWEKSSETDMSIPLGAGGIASTPKDLITFGEALFKGELISNQSFAKMTHFRDAFGYGLFYMPFYDKEGLGHTGGIDGFSSSWGYFGKDRISLALTSNGSNFNDNNIAIAILSALYGKEFKVPIFWKSEGKVLPDYTGIFRNRQLNMEIEIKEQNGNYTAQATGQMPFPLEKKSDAEFGFDMAGIVIEFNPDLKSFKLKQGGGEFVFIKE